MAVDLDYKVCAEQLSIKRVRIVLFSLYVPFVSPVKGYVCTCKKMGGAGGGSVERGGLLAGRGGGYGYSLT